METESVIVSNSSAAIFVLNKTTSSVPFAQDGSSVETQTITVSHISTTTVVVSQTPENVYLDQALKPEGSKTAWMVVAILFLVIAISSVTFSAILGYIVCKRVKIMEKPYAIPHVCDPRVCVQGEHKYCTKYIKLHIL